MTQQILTAALEVSAIASVAYIALALACFISRIDTRKPATSTPAPAQPKTDPEPEPISAEPADPQVTIATVIAPTVQAYQEMKVSELRKLAQSLHLPTRAQDANRRLNKKELLALLTQ